MPWNPGAGQSPNLSFALRTWAGQNYTVVRMRAGGDVYGDLIRVNVEYQPQLNELVHTFNGGTGGQYGGAIDFVTINLQLTSPASTGSAVVNVSNYPGGAPLSATQIAAITTRRAAFKAR
jgi:hypothetical protein